MKLGSYSVEYAVTKIVPLFLDGSYLLTAGNIFKQLTLTFPISHVILEMSLQILHHSSESDKHVCNVSNVVKVGDRMITGGDDGKLKVWTADLKLISESDLGTGGFLSIVAGEDAVYTCASDQTINAWDKTTFQHLEQIPSTLDVPLKLFVDPVSKWLWAGDSTGSVAKYVNHSETGRWELSEEVWDLLVTSDPTLVYTARDRDVAVTEILAGKRSNYVLRGTFQGRYPVTLIGDTICCLTRDGLSVQVNENSVESKFKLLHKILMGELIVNAMAVRSDNSLYVAGYDSRITQIDLNVGTCTASVEVGCCVNALTATSHGVYAALSDGQVVLVGS